MRRPWFRCVLSPALSSDPTTGEDPIDAWPYFDEEVLLFSRSRQVCITCQLLEGLISHRDHLTHRCPPLDPGSRSPTGLGAGCGGKAKQGDES